MKSISRVKGWKVMEGLKVLGRASHKLIFTRFFPIRY